MHHAAYIIHIAKDVACGFETVNELRLQRLQVLTATFVDLLHLDDPPILFVLDGSVHLLHFDHQSREGPLASTPRDRESADPDGPIHDQRRASQCECDRTGAYVIALLQLAQAVAFGGCRSKVTLQHLRMLSDLLFHQFVVLFRMLLEGF